MDEESDSIDRLSKLPDPLLLFILSLLETRDAVGTTLLSKRWKGLWTTVPCLSFFGATRSLDKFRNFVSGVFARWKGTKILKLTIAFEFALFLTSHLDSWLLHAIDKQVEELRLDMICSHGVFEHYEHTEYYPPQPLYSCSSIKKLTLVSYKLKIDKNVEWNQLLSLTIDVEESLSENAMEHILSGSPRLEVLELRIKETSHSLNIRSSSLKSLKINRFQNHVTANESMLRIWAPNLESLEISGVPCGRCLLSVPSLTNLILGFDKPDRVEDMLLEVFLSVLHVEKITLSYWCIEVFLELKKKDMVSSFPNAVFLRFYADAWNEIFGVVEMFPKLMMLVVERYELITLINADFHLEFDRFIAKIPEEPCILKFDSCESLESSPSLLHLRRVEVCWYMPDTSIFGVLESILENAAVLQKMVFRPVLSQLGPENLAIAEKKLLSMPRSSPAAEVIMWELKEEELERNQYSNIN